jgi:1-acyl-sn-glycerol-3-phosphate acyltransferase
MHNVKSSYSSDPISVFKISKVIVANHQSMMDVAAIFALNLKAAWVAKTTVFMIPGVGWLMYLAG